MHRTATFVDLKISAYGVSEARETAVNFETDPKPITEIMSQLSTLLVDGNRMVKKGRSEQSARLYISDYEIRQDSIVLLINRSDPTAPDAVSSDPENKSRIIHTKPEKHGGEYSAHIIISSKPIKGDNYYLCIIETVYGSGLHLSSLSDYIRFLFANLRKQFKEEYLIPHINGSKDKNGQPVLVRHVHTVELQGHPSDEFTNDLNTGTLSEIELISFSEQGATWDNKGAVTEYQRSVQLKPNKDMIGDAGSALRQVRAKVNKSYKEYDSIRIRFKNERGEAKDATIASDTGKLLDSDKYIKRHNISSPLVNTTSFEKINKFIIKEMIALME